MALFDDILSGGNWVTGLAIGVGAVVVLPQTTPILRPLAKTAIKGGILAYQSAAGLVEGIGDFVAEVAAEVGGELPRRQWTERRRPGPRGPAGVPSRQGYLTLLLQLRFVNHKISPLGLARGEAMNSIRWRSIIMRWLAVAFTLGAWAGVLIVMRQLLG
jgi:Protein of unknown function (DUF5132)